MSKDHRNTVKYPITAGHTSSISGEHNGILGRSNNAPQPDPMENSC